MTPKGNAPLDFSDPGYYDTISDISIEYLEIPIDLMDQKYYGYETKFNEYRQKLYKYYCDLIDNYYAERPVLGGRSHFMWEHLYHLLPEGHTEGTLSKEKGYRIRLEVDRSWNLEKL